MIQSESPPPPPLIAIQLNFRGKQWLNAWSVHIFVIVFGSSVRVYLLPTPHHLSSAVSEHSRIMIVLSLKFMPDIIIHRRHARHLDT